MCVAWTEWGSCVGSCAHGGRCVSGGAAGAGGEAGAGGSAVGAGGACACSGVWGGPRCQHYVGYDHACDHAACPKDTVCIWRPSSE